MPRFIQQHSPPPHFCLLMMSSATVIVWSVPELARRLAGHSRYVTSVAFSPDNTRLASASDDKTILVRQAPFDQPPVTLGGPQGHREGIRGIAFSPDGRKLVSAGLDNRALLWDVQTGTVDGPPLVDGTFDVNAVAFNPNGREVATVGCWTPGCSESAVRLWDLADRSRPRLRLPGPSTGIWSVAYNRDGTLLGRGAWPAGAHPDRNDVGAGWTICGGDWPDDRRLAPDGGRVRHPFLAVWRADSASLAADRDLLGSSRLRTFSFSHSLGLGVRGSAVLVGVLSHRGTPVPR